MEDHGKMKVTVVVPAYNSERTIVQCLEAIAGSTERVGELIVVDDASTDRTAALAGGFQCRILRLDSNHGPAHARHVGMMESRGDVVVFVDSDVLVEPDTIKKLTSALYDEPDVAAVGGILSKRHPNSNFLSAYKNLYMNFILSRCPRYVDFIYGSIFAYRKDRIRLPRTFMRLGEDTELGELINRQGWSILLDKDVQVVHMKRYGIASFARNDFAIPYHWAHLFIKHRGWSKILRRRRFFHARASQLASMPLPYLTVLALAVDHTLAAALSALFVMLNMDFFDFLRRERGVGFALASVPVTWLDTGIMALGAASGFALAIGGKAFHAPAVEGKDGP